MKSVLTVFVLLLVTSPSHAQLQKWNKRMQELSSTLADLMPDLVATNNSDERTKRISKNAAKLAGLAHSLRLQPGKESLLPPDADPSMTMISDLFLREIKRGSSALANGHVEYSKGILRNASNYCIACHTRTDSGPDFPGMFLTPKTERLSGFERAALLAASRQFDAALDEYRQVISDPKNAQARQIEWKQAAERALAIAVRVKQDPDQALSIVESIQKVPKAVFLTEYTASWREALLEWKKETPRKPASPESLVSEAKRLLSQGKAMQKFPMDHLGDIYFLRATNVLHQQLRIAPTGAENAETLFLLGTAYEVLNDPTLYPLHERYYETCIRQTPHSKLASQCYQKYEESIYFGYSGSGGPSIPRDVQASLEELKTLAKPERWVPGVPKGFFDGKL